MRARRSGTASVLLLRPVVAAAEACGVAPRVLYDALGLAPQVLTDRDATVEGPLIARAWQEAAARTGDAAFGLHVGERVQTGAYDLLDYLALSSRSFRETIDRVGRYYRLLSDHVEIGWEPAGARLQLVHRPRVGPAEEWRHAWECFFAASVVRARRVLGAGWAPHAIELMHAAPRDLREHARIFRAPIRFGAPRNLMVVDTTDAERPLPTADPVLGRLLEGYADELVRQLPAPGSIVSEARAALLEALRGGDVSLAALATRLRASRRTLQRKLAEAGTSHQQLLDDCRHQLALAYLGDARLSIDEIAFLLGFAQTSAFHRAFRRWTGRTPAAHRAEISASSPRS